MTEIREAVLVLADGESFDGEAIGADPPGGVAGGEVVFNTVLTGYQEVLTDPSYAGQIITFTYPHIGNYGVTALDAESGRAVARGVVVRELARRRSNWRSEGDLDDLLRASGVAGIAGVDTRRLTRHIREAGAMPGAFGPVASPADVERIAAAARAEPGTTGVDLVTTVSTERPYRVEAALGAPDRLIVAYDYGIKSTMLRQLSTLATVEVVPAGTPADEVLARRPDGVLLSNGPGDPATVTSAPATIRALLGEVPVFGICLGHQLLATALGATTYKLPFGHHGGNHPVQRVATGAVEITSQNHSYAVAEGSLAGCEVTHVNLNDGVIEGIRCTDAPAFSVQYHPEAGPGPHDARYLFGEFEALMDRVGGAGGRGRGRRGGRAA